MLLKEQIFVQSDERLSMYMRERKGETLHTMAKRAEEYVEGHHFRIFGKKGRTTRDDSAKPPERGGAKPNFDRRHSGSGRHGEPRCYLCNQKGHMAKDCRSRGSDLPPLKCNKC